MRSLCLQPLFQSESIVVEADLQHHYLHITWLMQPSNGNFQEYTSRIAAFAIEKQIVKALFDVRLRHYLEVSDQNWVQREIMPLFSGMNLKMAYLTTFNNLQMMDTLHMQEAVLQHPALNGQFEIEVFLEAEDALKWLQV